MRDRGYFENRVLRRIFGPKRMKEQDGVENYIMRGSIACTLHQILLELSDQGL
jgi:hypothetical protein